MTNSISRRTIGPILLAGCLTWLMYGCSSGLQSKSVASDQAAATPATEAMAGKVDTLSGAAPSTAVWQGNAPAAISARHNLSVTTRKVVRRANLEIRVPNVEATEKKVNHEVNGVGGYVESTSSSELATDHPSMTLAARVPVGSFDSTIAKFESMGVRLSKVLTSDDVTTKIVDMDAELKTLTAQEDVYRQMLHGRQRLDEVFKIQQELATVRTQIEQISAERRTTANLADMSTITLTLRQDGVVSAPGSDPNWIQQSWAGATSGASSSFRWLATMLMWVVAFAPLWIPVLLVLRRVVKAAIGKREPAY